MSTVNDPQRFERQPNTIGRLADQARAAHGNPAGIPANAVFKSKSLLIVQNKAASIAMPTKTHATMRPVRNSLVEIDRSNPSPASSASPRLVNTVYRAGARKYPKPGNASR